MGTEGVQFVGHIGDVVEKILSYTEDETGVQEALRRPYEPEWCVLGPHLPGWPLVNYQGSLSAHHGPARVVEAYIEHGQFRLTIITDRPILEPEINRVLSSVRLASIAPLGY